MAGAWPREAGFVDAQGLSVAWVAAADVDRDVGVSRTSGEGESGEKDEGR